MLAFATQKTSQFAGSAELQTQAIQSNILQLISAPIDAYVSIFTAIGLPSLVPLLQLQPYMTRRAVAKVVIRSLLSSQSTVSSITDLELLLQVLKVLIKEGIQYAPSYPGSPVQRRPTETDETIEEQGWLARLVHLLYNSNNHEHFKVCCVLSSPPVVVHYVRKDC